MAHEIPGVVLKDRPIPDAAEAVQAAASSVESVADEARKMLLAIQSGWLWVLLTKKAG